MTTFQNLEPHRPRFPTLAGGLLVFCAVLMALPQSAVYAQASAPAPYVSPMRAQCIDELAKDSDILAACKEQYSADYHEVDARRSTRNKQHVVAAYAVLWGILVVFVVALWLRQQKLNKEISRLEDELKRAMEE